MVLPAVSGGEAPHRESIRRSVDSTWFACSTSMARTERCFVPPSASGPSSPATSSGPSRWKSICAQYLPIAARRPVAGARLELVAQIERGRVHVVDHRLREEARVHAFEGLRVAVVSALDGRAALGQWEAAHLHAAVAVAGALGLLEELAVDLAAKDLVHATHEAAAGLLVVIEVEELAPRGDAARRVHHAVAERAALATLMQLVGGGCGYRRHLASVE